MKLKNYIGATVREALDRAKVELGEDFVLLDSKQIEKRTAKGGKEQFMQVTVALDNAGEQLKSPAPSPAPENPFEKLYYQVNNNTLDIPESNSRVMSEVASLRQELGRLNTQLRSISGANFPAPYDQINDSLVEAGVGRDLSAMLTRHSYLKSYQLEQVTYDLILATVGSEMLDHVELRLREPVVKRKKPEIIMLVGPTGVGKTTAVMKLAANADYYGGRKIAILTTDTYRVAATEPLKAFSRIVNIPIMEASPPADVAEMIDTLSTYDVVLVDTPGRSPRFPNYLKELQEYRKLLQPSEVLLTLGLTAGVEDILLATGLFYSLNLTGMLLTKLDETGRPGKILSIIEEIDLPLKYITAGQSVPKDIENVNAELIVNAVMKMMRKI